MDKRGLINNFIFIVTGYRELQKGHAAHITLGTAMDVPASKAKNDMTLSHLCNRNQLHNAVHGNITVYPQEELAVIALNKSVPFIGIFAGYYY